MSARGSKSIVKILNMLVGDNHLCRFFIMAHIALASVFISLWGDASCNDAYAEDAASITLYAAPQGVGQDCNADHPCALIAAKLKARALNAEAPRDITIQLANGIYFMDHPLQFDAADSGRNGHIIRYIAETKDMAVLSGAVPVENWTLINPKSNLWSAPLPDTIKPDAETGMMPRAFFIDDKRAERARLPINPIYSGHAFLGNVKVPKDNSGYLVTFPGMENWKNSEDIEIVYTNYWTMARCPVAHIKSGFIEIDATCLEAVKQNSAFKTAGLGLNWLENNLAFLSVPNQFYLDRSARKIYYKAAPTQDMNKSLAMIGRSDQLMILNNASHLQFDGLSFRETNWYGYQTHNPQIPYVGYTPHQSGDNAQLRQQPVAAIDVIASEYITFTNSNFYNLGGSGIKLRAGASSIELLNNRFVNIAAIGVQIGTGTDYRTTDPKMQNAKIRIENNLFSDNGSEYWDNPAIMAFALRESSIAHNEIKNCAWSCVALGWGLGKGPPLYNQNITISKNWIHDGMQRLDDGGGIYTNGTPSDTITIDSNVIERIGNVNSVQKCEGDWRYPSHMFHGIYHDEGSRFYSDTNNLVVKIRPPQLNDLDPTACRGTWLSLGSNMAQVKGNVTDDDHIRIFEGLNLTPTCKSMPDALYPKMSFGPTSCLPEAESHLLISDQAGQMKAKAIRAQAGIQR